MQRRQNPIDRFIAEYGAPSQPSPTLMPLQPVQPPVQASIGWFFVILIVLALLAVAAAFIIPMAMRNSGPPMPPDWIPEPQPTMDSRWDESREAAGNIRSVLQILRAENSGTNPGITTGRVIDNPLIMKEYTFDTFNYFDPQDFQVEVADGDRFEWTIVVHSSSADGPTGTYRLDSSGNDEFSDD
ncbi:MAG: hypothetical protein AB7S36_16335 [Planctomycetota bacterium]